jgi:hypothetical protein
MGRVWFQAIGSFLFHLPSFAFIRRGALLQFLGPNHEFRERNRLFCLFLRLFVMRPHADNLHRFDFFQNLIYKSVLDIDAP